MRKPRAWVLAPAAACVLVLAAFLVRELQSPSSVRLTSDATETASGLRGKGSGLSEVQPSALSTQPFAFSPQPSVRPLADAANVATLAADSDLQPLTTAPIELAALDVSPLVVAMPIEISTIAIDRIEISAMP